MARKVFAAVCAVMLSLGLVAGAVHADDSRWSIDADGVILDSQTGLQWYVGPNNLGWEQAMSYCQYLSVAGGGWRMPSLNELRGLYTGRENWDSHHSMPPAFKGKERKMYEVFSREWGITMGYVSLPMYFNFRIFDEENVLSQDVHVLIPRIFTVCSRR